jgi:hypothetical protein
MVHAIRDGFSAVRRSLGLVAVVFGVNIALAAALAVPLSGLIQRGLEKRESAARMLHGFDYAWWSRWSEEQPGWAAAFRPDIFGSGFAFRDLDALLRGQLPAGLLLPGRGEGGLDPVIGALGLLYLLLQTFLLGGILGAFRSAQGSWTARGLLHGSSFYFGRFVRIAVIALACDALLLHLNVPFARFIDARATEAVSESTAIALSLGRHALLLAALLLVSLVSTYAKVVVVLEERRSAVLAVLSALAFCAGNARRVLSHYAAMLLAGLLLLGVWATLDGRLETTGYRSQLVALALMQALVLGRIALRLALLAGQVALYRRDAA